MALTARQFVAVPVPPPTRGIEFLIGVIKGYKFFEGACRSYATKPGAVLMLFATVSSVFSIGAPRIPSSIFSGSSVIEPLMINLSHSGSSQPADWQATLICLHPPIG